MGLMVNKNEVSQRDKKKVLKLDNAMIVQLCNYATNHWIYTLKDDFYDM